MSHDVASPRVPVVDLSLFDGDLLWRDHVAAQVDWAAAEFGFFYVIGHGVDAALIETLRSLSRAFFARPEAEKQRVRMALGGRALHVGDTWFVDRYTGNATTLFRIFNDPPATVASTAGQPAAGSVAGHEPLMGVGERARRPSLILKRGRVAWGGPYEGARKEEARRTRCLTRRQVSPGTGRKTASLRGLVAAHHVRRRARRDLSSSETPPRGDRLICAGDSFGAEPRCIDACADAAALRAATGSMRASAGGFGCREHPKSEQDASSVPRRTLSSSQSPPFENANESAPLTSGASHPLFESGSAA